MNTSLVELPKLNTEILPEFASVPYGFESYLDIYKTHDWMQKNWTISFLFVIGYLASLTLLKTWMKEKARFEMKKILVYWNLGLALFSAIGTARIAPEFFSILGEPNGYHKSVCDSKTLESPVFLFWGWLFTLSKVLELGDTVFLVLRKRPLTFLHVYHHCTVLLCCWYGTAIVSPISRWYATMNYFVHSIMYTYFAAQVLRWFSISKGLAMTITAMQIAQMIFGVAVNYHAYQVKATGGTCAISNLTVVLGLTMYFSYFVLFVHFFYGAYLSKGKSVGKKAN